MVLNTEIRSFMLLGVDDSLLTTHLLSITKNANKEFNALTRVQKYMTTDQKSFYFLLY